MASSASVWMGPSFAVPFVFANADLSASVKKKCGLEEGMFLASDRTFEELIYGYFGNETKEDKKISDSLIYHITNELGEAKCVREIGEEHLRLIEKRNSPFPFFFAEDAALVTFEEYTVLIAVGNNE